METQRKNTAILFFTRTAHQEALHKDFSGVHNTHFNTIAAEHLISHTQKVIRKSGLPCFIIDSNHQQGNTFGERLGNAIEEIFSFGFENIITIGNDCPNLSVHHLLCANKQLENCANVLGQDSHGGAYLIGITAASFNKEDFISLPWETKTIFSALTSLLKNIYKLNDEDDLNYANDVKLLLQKSPLSPISIFFQNIIASLGLNNKKPLEQIHHYLAAFFFSIKAPPISI